MKVVEYPNKLLRRKSKNIKKINNHESASFAEELIKTMVAQDGLGLAAPQVGRNINLLAVNFKDQPLVLINPRTIWKNWFKKIITEEGCLSFPGIFGLVKRPRFVTIHYRDLTGKRKFGNFKGLAAVVIQHEIDHLRGRLFIDRIIKYTKGENKLKIVQAKAKSDEQLF